MSQKIWEIRNEKPLHKNEEVLEVLLKNRGLETENQKKEFLNPTHPKNLTLKSLGIKKSEIVKITTRIKKAIQKKESIVVFGDYDADGVCATAVLWETLHALGAKAMPYIPDRFSEGYGLNAESVKHIKEKDPEVSLIITVDNGIVAFEGAKACNKIGTDLIITDHHAVGKSTPPALAIAHTTKICGAALSWMVAREIIASIKKGKPLNNLELAAIGTISDIMPLLGPNRAFALHGLEDLNKTHRVGLKALLNEASVEKVKIGTYEVGFIIAPRINAMGRLDHAIDALRLLCTGNRVKAKGIAQKIEIANKKRQQLVDELVTHALEKSNTTAGEPVIVVADEKYHEGVIGLIASRLTEKFWKPSIVFSVKEDLSKASGRSIKGINIIENIRKLEHLIIEGGGHAQAAGFTIKNANIDKFIKSLQKLIRPLLTANVQKQTIEIDTVLHFSQINYQLLDLIQKFSPTGFGNPTPIFASFGVKASDVRRIGKENNHLKFKVILDNQKFDAIAFNLAERYKELESARSVDIVYSLEENIWNGKKSIQLKIKDIVIPH